VALKQDRPVDYGDDGIVVYVAKNKEEVDKAREALLAAEIPVDLPEAAVEALFAAGRDSLPIRVPAMHFKAAGKVIDEVFPPEVIDLPPLPDEEGDAGAGGAGVGSPVGSDELANAPEGGQDRYRPQVSSGPSKQDPRKVAEAANKVVFIALGSFLIPVAGVFLALFSLYSAWWCMDRLPLGSTGREKGKIGFGLSIGSILWNLGFAAYVSWKMGLFDR